MQQAVVLIPVYILMSMVNSLTTPIMQSILLQNHAVDFIISFEQQQYAFGYGFSNRFRRQGVMGCFIV